MRIDLSDATIIFDLDGTLVDTAGDLAAAMNHALTRAGRKPVAAARVRRLVGLGARAMLAEGFAENGAPAQTPAEMDAHIAVFLDYYMAHIADRSRPFPGAVAALETLKAAQAAIAICTNKREAPARLLIETLRLSGLFDAIVGLDTTKAGKPDPAPVLHCLKLTGRQLGVFVGDSDTDVNAAKAAAMPCLLAEFGYGPLTLQGQTHALFRSYSALPRLVASALNR